jgi:hypothetical protein
LISVPGVAPSPSGRLRALLARCHDDPCLFNAAILGGAPFWWRQVQMSRMVVDHHTLAVAAGNSVGKSHWLARLVWWWLCTRARSLVVTTAPTHDQLDAVLWKNIRQAAAASRVPLGARILSRPLKADMGNGWMALGVATTKTERMAGHHNPELLAIEDEASGISREITEAIDSLVPAKRIQIGNPIRYDCAFRETFELGLSQATDPGIPPHERTVSLRVPSTDSPDVHLDRSPRGLAAGAWLRQMERKYGREGLWWRCHIDALFPEEAESTLIPPAWLDGCTLEELKPLRRSNRAGPARQAADLGEGCGRDRTVIVVRDDLGVLDIWSENDVDTDGAALAYAQLGRKHGVKDEHCSYDAAGAVGKDFGNRLKANGIHAFAYKGASSGGKDFTNLRTACAFRFRRRIDRDHVPDPRFPLTKQLPFHVPVLPCWPWLREELLALRYHLVERKTALERKEDLAKALGRSPDHGDALIQTWVTEILGRN